MQSLRPFSYIEDRRGEIMAKLSDFNKQFDTKTQTSNNVEENDIVKEYNKIKDLSQQEINAKLFDEVAKQKRDGTFDYQKLEQMVENLKGGLSEQDYKNVKRMLELLR